MNNLILKNLIREQRGRRSNVHDVIGEAVDRERKDSDVINMYYLVILTLI